MSAEMLDAHPYRVYVFDCPYCGNQTMLGDSDLQAEEVCDDCDLVVEMTL